MPATSAEPPAVSLSFANNFWGKDDAGVVPLLGRMQASKQTCDELKSFYSARASLEDEYSRKLLALCRKPLGSQETGSLRASFDTLRGEVESMGRQHQNIAAQMKSELEEPLAAFSGGMKERRKIVQNGIEKLHKIKIQQTQQVNKTRDRYEQECLKIKGYLAQGHMVMGQEERKNKAKLEKTQISVATSNTEYENAVKALEDTTSRWNREWKAAADKFQDLEEERLDFTKSSLWQFANISSTVCVSDDASCEKIRLSLEKVDVETDIITFIKERGTGQEIPDAPKYINFCRGDMTDTQSEASEDDSYSVAQFPRSINPAFRSSSPQPSTYESHHDPNSLLAHELGHRSQESLRAREASTTPRGIFATSGDDRRAEASNVRNTQPQTRTMPDTHERGPIATIPHDPYPLDGMTMLCRTGAPSERSSQPNSARPGSRDSHSDYSNPTSISSVEVPSGKTSPIKQEVGGEGVPDKRVLKKRSGFFQNHSPFRRKSTREMKPMNTDRNTWHSASVGLQGSPTRRPQLFMKNEQDSAGDEDVAGSPEPIDANATLALNVGSNVFSVSTPDLDRRTTAVGSLRADESDPIALALAELRGVSPDKQATARVSADRYHGIATPAPTSQPQFSRSIPATAASGSSVAAVLRGAPPPSYDQPIQRLGVPQPAVTARAMKETSQKFADQTRTMFGSGSRPGSDISTYGNQVLSRTGTRTTDMPRAVSPATPRSKSPRPVSSEEGRHRYQQSSSPSPGTRRVGPAQTWSSEQSYHRNVSPNHHTSRSASPAQFRQYARSNSGLGQSDMAMQLAPSTDQGQGSQRGRGDGRPGTSSSSRAMGLYDGGGPIQGESRQRSKSVADPSRQYTSDGRPILHFAKALYVYQAAIPEELGFSKGDVLAVLRHQDDGWWEAEVQGGGGQIGLVPSNYLQPY